MKARRTRAQLWRWKAAAAAFFVLAATTNPSIATAQGGANGGGTGVVINEILATNHGSITGIVDADGDSPDFIELHNTMASRADIGEWALIDGDDIWEFPLGTSIAAGGYLVVWASGKDRSTGPEFHTNFKLREKGEYLALFDDAGEQVSLAGDPYPDQYPNVSWGVAPGAGERAWFLDPTPGAQNANQSVAGVVAAPSAELGRGFYDGSITETLTSATPGAEIRYTTDGRPPTQASSRYNGSLVINPDSTGVVTVRAKAFKAGFAASAEASWSYVFAASLYNGLPADGIESLPVIVVNTDDQTYPTESDRVRVAIEMIETDPAKAGFAVTAGVKEFGETSVQFEKSNLRVFFEAEYGPSELDYPVFDGYGQGIIEPATTFDKLELRGGSWDSWQAAAGGRFSPSDYYLTDRFIRDTRLDMGALTPHGRFVTVFINGDFRGLYQLRERFDHTFYESYAADGEDADTIEAIKVNDGRYSNNGDQNVNGDGSVFDGLTREWQQDKDVVDGEAMVDFILAMSLADDDFEREYRGVGSMDPASPNDYVFLYNDNDMRLRPVSNVLGDRLGYAPGYYVPPLLPHFESYRTDPEFLQIVHERAASALCPGGALTLASMRERLNYWVDEIDLAMWSEDERWEGVRSIDYFGSNYVADKYGSWQQNIAGLRTRMTQLHGGLESAWADEGLFVGCSRRPVVTVGDQASPLGEPVSWTVPAADPDGDAMTFAATGLPPGLAINASTGEVSGTPTAQGTFDVAVTVTDTRGRWIRSELAWTVRPGVDLRDALVINEIMYHPADDVSPLPIDPDLAGFVEIVNATQQSLDISGVRFASGVDYTIGEGVTLAGGATWVVAESAAAFARVYGFEPDGVYGGGLSNAGERLVLQDGFGRLIDEVAFDDEGPWPVGPDGEGGSLSLVDVALDNAAASSWRASPGRLGSPGTTNVVFEPGDVNGSDSIDTTDVQAILHSLTGAPNGTFYEVLADVDEDGSVTLADAIVLAHIVDG